VIRKLAMHNEILESWSLADFPRLELQLINRERVLVGQARFDGRELSNP
jgi:hypothetical protein